MSYKEPLDKYVIYVKLRVLGESPEDALEYADEAIEASNLLDQDGILGVELLDDIDTVENEEDYDDSSDNFREDLF